MERPVISDSPYADLVRGDRIPVLGGIVTLTCLAWLYTARIAADMGSMASSMAMPTTRAWSPADGLFMFVMWVVMMVAMMLPSATPMILLFTRVVQRREAQGRPVVSTTLFLVGYLLIWTGFSGLATLANWGLHSLGLLSSMMGRTPPLVGGIFLIAAGVFQWTPLKNTCLSHCRSPLLFLTLHWHEGRVGTLRMGIHHGLWCLGCCWLLMALLFALGIMNLPWIAALTVFVLLEKVLPNGQLVSRASGSLLATWGTALLVMTLGG